MEIPQQFKAMVVEEAESKKFVRRIGTKSIDELPDGEVLIRVNYFQLPGLKHAVHLPYIWSDIIR